MGKCRALRFGIFYWQVVQAVEHFVGLAKWSRVQVPFCQQTIKYLNYGKSNRELGIDLARHECR